MPQLNFEKAIHCPHSVCQKSPMIWERIGMLKHFWMCCITKAWSSKYMLAGMARKHTICGRALGSLSKVAVFWPAGIGPPCPQTATLHRAGFHELARQLKQKNIERERESERASPCGHSSKDCKYGDILDILVQCKILDLSEDVPMHAHTLTASSASCISCTSSSPPIGCTHRRNARGSMYSLCVCVCTLS